MNQQEVCRECWAAKTGKPSHSLSLVKGVYTTPWQSIPRSKLDFGLCAFLAVGRADVKRLIVVSRIMDKTCCF